MPPPSPDVLIRGGTVFDGTGAPGIVADVLVRGGVIDLIGLHLDAPDGAEIIDASGCWVSPGFVDLHTHYDAEVEIAPGLGESVRHGVTTVLIGSCGLSMAVGEPEDLADMFCRVEGIPRARVLPLLEEVKDWDGPAGYLDHLGRLPLGPNLVCMLGHSTIRAAAMGLGRSLTRGARPTEAELGRMDALLTEALDAGYVGLSINTLPWDKMGGERFRSRPTPSVFGSWREYWRLARTLRARGRVFQGLPNLQTKVNIGLFLLTSVGLRRPALKTSILTFLDAKATRGILPPLAMLTRIFNTLLGADVRFQSLPCTFDLYTDGLDVPVMEEIGGGTEALHLTEPQARAQLLRDPAFRKRFRRQWIFSPRAWHRRLDEAKIIDCPDAAVVGKTFTEVARARGADPLDTFLDLQAEHDARLRWYSVVGNDRPEVLRWIMGLPEILIGFSDAGAHLRNMAYYNYPLRMLRAVREAERAGAPFMTTERAIWRLTGEIADWMGVDAGRLAPGRRADVAVIDPEGLTEAVDRPGEAPMEGFPSMRRVVRRNDAAVRAVLINGRIAWRGRRFTEGFGQEPGYGAVLRC